MAMTRAQEFAFRAAPTEWAGYADELMDAADKLFEEQPSKIAVSFDAIRGLVSVPGHSRSHLLLIACSLENVMKGIAVARNPNLVSGGKLDKKLETHKLTHLATSMVALELSDEERGLLELLEGAIPSWGRYPVPRTIHRLAKEEPASSDLKHQAETLFRRLRSVLDDLIEDGWKGPHGMRMHPSMPSDSEEPKV